MAQAEAVLDRNRPVNAAERGSAYRQAGWTSFDPEAPAYTTEEVNRERSAYGSSARY